MTDDRDAIWVQSDLAPDGTSYMTAIHYDADQSRVLDRESALACVEEIHRAAVQAEHDAAVIRQLTSIGIGLEEAARAVAGLRADRPPLDESATAPLRLVPGVSQKTGQAFLAVHISGRQVGQWDPADARDHASHILAVQAAADLDAAYRRYLLSAGLDTETANAVVNDLAEHIEGTA